MSPSCRRFPFASGWWKATLRARPLLGLLGRWASPVPLLGAGLVLDGCAELMTETQPASVPTALDEQQSEGWNVGGADRPLIFPGAQAADISGGLRWRDPSPTLASRLAPAGPRWSPYYVPTLFQALETPRNTDLRAMMRPIFTDQMAAAAGRGQALLSLLMDDHDQCRGDVAIVLDLPGPEAVAVAAALAPCLDPVFVFANWPHPWGVVPSHLTLGAALYYLPTFEDQRAARRATSAPVFVLDRDRLSPYTDAADAFDNRYLVGLPPAESLRAAGIQHVVYVTPNDRATRESDDLNDDLVAMDSSGLDVQMLALSDFSRTPLPGWPEVASADPQPPIIDTDTGLRFYFGGSVGTHRCFRDWYGWSRSGASSPSTSSTMVLAPPQFAARLHFHPAPHPSFVVAPHASGGARRFSGITGGHFGFGRSGSTGRAHFGMSG